MSDTDDAFETFWSVKPKREGPDSKKDARTKFTRLVAKGHDPQRIISAARKWAADNPTPTRFIPMAATWLNQERFEDIAAAEVPSKDLPNRYVRANGEIWEWNGSKWECVKSNELERYPPRHETGQGAE